ncbi:MAG: zinc-binding dehydrogenase [Actinomycetota bacterium]
MRAGTFVELGRVVCLDQPEPTPVDGDLVVRTELASICGSDLHIVMDGVGGLPPVGSDAGGRQAIMAGSRTSAWPGYPGHEGIGEVIESHHPDFKPGDRVLCAPDMSVAQCFAEIQALPARHCHKLPDTDVSAAELLMAQQLGTVIFALRQDPVDVTGKNVVVLGSGSAGQFHTYMMKRMGAEKVITIDPVATRLEVATAMGADVVIDASVVDVEEAVAAETDGRGADYLIEAVGRRDALLQTTELAGVGASMLWFGLPDSNEPVPIDFNHFFRKKLRASSTYGAQNEGDQSSFKTALGMIARGEIDVAQVVSHTLPIERIEEAMVMAHERTDGARKVSISFG